MLGTTLEAIRSHVESLASEDGSYYLVCARDGDRPVPAADRWFATKTEARAGARATEQYRAALRRYDPQLPRYDVIVCQTTGFTTPSEAVTGAELSDAVDRADLDPDRTPSIRDRSSRVEYCHRVAAAVFEALSDCGDHAVESAVLDAYFELVERVSDFDDRCLCLLEGMTAVIDRRLAIDEQTAVVDTAVSRLPGPDSTDYPIAATLASLERRDLMRDDDWSPAADERDPDARDVVVRFSEYALSPRDDRLPLLPIVVELVRHQSVRRLTSLRVVDVGDAWRVRLRFGRAATPGALVTARIQSEV